MTEQGTSQIPSGIRTAAGRDVAKLCGNERIECHGLLASVQAAADDGKVHLQSLFVLHNLRLLGHHAHVCGITLALVVDEYGELCRYDRFYFLCQGVVAIDVALHEVGQIQFG